MEGTNSLALVAAVSKAKLSFLATIRTIRASRNIFTICLSTFCLWTISNRIPRLARMQQILLALGKRLRELRSDQGFSQEAFADHCGLHRTAMSLIERGKRVPSLRTLVTLSQGFGISLSELLEDVDKGIAKKRK
jgi:DNA-binding XRE family transcriptional regulator